MKLTNKDDTMSTTSKTEYRMKVGASMIVAGAAIVGVIWRLREPKTDHLLPPPPCPQAQQPPVPPVDGDMICEANKGEADPASTTFSARDCGYCGDGIRQVQIQAERGSPPRPDEFGALIQDVTQRQSETPETCPIDFHCGNGRQDIREKYSAIVPPISLDGGVYSYQVVEITETSADCARDYRRTYHRPAQEVPEDPIPIRQPSMWTCPSQVASTDSLEIVGSQSESMRSVIRRINDSIIPRSAALRTALGVQPADPVTVTLSILVSSGGRVSLQGVAATCSGLPCGDQTAIVNATSLSLNGLSVGAPGAECIWRQVVVVPRS
ncbi:MAG: hypothetical protein U0R44_05985 [Candidatus Micrarchaeia archaeon]